MNKGSNRNLAYTLAKTLDEEQLKQIAGGSWRPEIIKRMTTGITGGLSYNVDASVDYR